MKTIVIFIILSVVTICTIFGSDSVEELQRRLDLQRAGRPPVQHKQSGPKPVSPWIFIEERKDSVGWLDADATVKTERMDLPNGFILRTLIFSDKGCGSSMVYVPTDPGQKLEEPAK